MGGGIQTQHGKLGAHLRRGTIFGRGQPGVSGGRAGGRSGAGGGWANVKVGNAGGACRSSTWATEEGGQKIKGEKKKKSKRRGEEGEKDTFLIGHTLYF